MSARGIAINYSTDPGYSYAGRTGISVSCATDIAVKIWMRIKGNNGNHVGQVPFSIYDSNNDEQMYLADGDADGAPWQLNPQIYTNGAYNFGPLHSPVADDEDWFIFMLWDAVLGKWTGHTAKDGAGSLFSAAGTSGHTNVHTFNRVKVGCVESFQSGYGTNAELTDFAIWAGAGLVAHFDATAILAEMKSDAPVYTTNLYLDWPLASSSDTTDRSGNGRTPTMTGTVGNGTMDPVDLRGVTAFARQNLQRLPSGLYVHAAAGLDGLLVS